MRAQTVNQFQRHQNPKKTLGIGMEFQIDTFLATLGRSLKDDPVIALSACASYNKIKYVEFLLDSGVDIHGEDEHPLRVSAFKEQYEMAKYLIKRGANLEKAIEVAQGINEEITLRNLLNLKDMIGAVKESQEFTRGRDPLETMNLGKAGLKPFLINKALDALPKNTYKTLVEGFGTKEIYYFGDNDVFYQDLPGFYDYLAELLSGKPLYTNTAKYRYHNGRERVEQEDLIEIFDTEIGKIAKVTDTDPGAGGVTMYAGDFQAAIGVNLRNKTKLLNP